MSCLPPHSYFGANLLSMSGGGFFIRESSYPSGTRLPRHAHRNDHFCFVLSGEYIEQIEGTGRRERTRSDLIFYPSGCSHEEHHSYLGHHLLIELEPQLTTRFEEIGRLPERPSETSSTIAKRIVGQMVEELRKMDALSPLAMEGLVLELLAETARVEFSPRPKEGPPWLASVLDRLQSEFADPPTLDELSREVSIHPSHLSRTFRQRVGCTLSEHVRRLRVDEVSRLLLEADRPLAEIATECGFYDQSHMTRTFLRVTGTTPGRFRLKHRF